MQRRTHACSVLYAIPRRLARCSSVAAALATALSVLAAAPAARADGAQAAAGARDQRDQDGGPPPVATALFVVGVDLEIAGRALSYSDLLSENLRTYEALGVPMPCVWGELFPLAQSALPVLRDLGLSLSYARAVGLASEGVGGARVSTSWNRLHAGLRGRYRLDGQAGPVVFGTFGLAWTGFDIEPTGDPSRDAASVSYVALRLGLDGRLPVGPVALEAGGGYQAPLSTGRLALYFREPSAHGVDARLVLAVPFTPRTEARAGATYTRFFYDFDPEPGDLYIAGGALDQLFSVHLGVSHAY